jgi:hypothetical protein
MAEAVNSRRLDEKRFVDVSSESNKILPPLPQISESEAIPTLLDAIKSSEHLVENLGEKAKEALNNCKNPKGKLTHDQAAALYLYSMQWPEGQFSFFFLFNRALRSEDRTRLVPYHNYFKLFMSALNKLPSIEQQVWRGVDVDLTDRYLPGNIVFSYFIDAINRQTILIDITFFGQDNKLRLRLREVLKQTFDIVASDLVYTKALILLFVDILCSLTNSSS